MHNERTPSLESAEMLELAGALSRVRTWIGNEKNTSLEDEFLYGPFAAQVYRVFDSRRGIYVTMQGFRSALVVRPWMVEVNPLGVSLEQQAREAFAELYGRGFEVLDPRELDLNLRKEDEGAIEFMIGLGEEATEFDPSHLQASFPLTFLSLLAFVPPGISISTGDLNAVRVRLYPWENSLPDEKDGGLLGHLEQIGHECIVAVPSMDYMDGNPEAYGYAFYHVGSEEGNSVVTKLNVDTPLTGKDNRGLQEC